MVNQFEDVDLYDAGETVTPTIEIDESVLPIALRHGCELWWDGSTPTKRLDTRDGREGFTRFVNARVEGKLGEVAFKEFLHEYYGIDSAVDWRIYGDYTETDDGDLQYVVDDDGEQHPLAVPTDIKKTKPWNQWLAVRQEIYNRIEDDAPIILVKLSIQDDLILDEWSDANEWSELDEDERFRDRLLAFVEDNFPLSVELVGTAYKHEFTDQFDKGDKLYDPDTGATLGGPLKRPNMGIHVTDLYNSPERWNRVIADTIGDLPITADPMYVVDPDRWS